jgi:hypothetical protein
MKICQKCNAPIYRNGVMLQKKHGRGYKDIGICHNHCANKEIKKGGWVEEKKELSGKTR